MPPLKEAPCVYLRRHSCCLSLAPAPPVRVASVNPLPVAVKLIASYGVATRPAIVAVTPVVNLVSVSINPVEGGFGTNGLITLNFPAQGSGAVISLSSSSTSLVLPATITIPTGYNAVNLSATTSAVTVATSVSVTATYKGLSVATTVC